MSVPISLSADDSNVFKLGMEMTLGCPRMSLSISVSSCSASSTIRPMAHDNMEGHYVVSPGRET